VTAVATPPAAERRRVRVIGVVQGVGFRPFVHRLATELGLAGHVGNDADGVFAEVEGEPPGIDEFEVRLTAEAPPLAHIFGVTVTSLPVRGECRFRIVDSPPDQGPAARTFVSPDIAVCADCLAEMSDPSDRRHRYPFINCTNCGPRFTITLRLPYDRINTTMREFDLCMPCRAEYHDPGDRRFHAQPVACADCGPRLWFENPALGATVLHTNPAISAAQESLACDATSGEAVDRLRRRKERLDKPLAVMVRDLETARTLAHIGPEEAALLTSPQRPIVLLPRRSDSALSDRVAPQNPHIGLLLPYTPLHHLLFRPVPGSSAPAPDMMVMTSGNLTDEPICHDDADARSRLGRIADTWLLHDRRIHVPCDDSVVRVDDGAEMPIRRSRGFAPLPVRLPFDVTPTLAMGGELKNTFCLAEGRHAWVSQHIGDMGSTETLAAFERSVAQFGRMYQVVPGAVAADAHPAYQTRRWADERSGYPVELVQHHHAHIASVMAEHGAPRGERVIGFAFDGTGYGTDGAIWGGEVLIAGYDGFERAAHLRYVPLPGGDATVGKPYRAALAHLWAAGIDWAPDLPPVQAAGDEELAVLERQLERNVACVATSSMGRLFDAVSSLLAVRHTASYEAQAAIELEWAAASHLHQARHYRFGVDGGQIDAAPVLAALTSDLRLGCPTGAMAAGFHVAVAAMVAEQADLLHHETGLDQVALSGGVFQNTLLLRLARAALSARGLPVYSHRLVPPNDGGLALGQAVVAGSRPTSPAGAQ
jgi:hydrogenase maturation protein HypF